MQVKDLTPNPENPRAISKEKLAMLKKSLSKFGDLSGIVFNKKTYRLVGGHQRVAGLDGKEKIVIENVFKKPTSTGTLAMGYILINDERHTYREVEWDEATEKAANIAANKGAGEWDISKLTNWMQELNELNFDLDLTMFDTGERAPYLDIGDKQGLCDEDEVPEVPKKSKTKLGDIYQLGAHRLMCGDSTKLEMVEKLMDGEKADTCFTSPPYNLGKSAVLRRNKKMGSSVYNNNADNMDENQYFDFMRAFTDIALKVSDTAFINIQYVSGNKFVIPKFWAKYAENTGEMLIWDKIHGPPAAAAAGVLTGCWEFIFYLVNEHRPNRKIKHGPPFCGNKDNIFRLSPLGKKDEFQKDHGAVFPVAFAEHFISNFSDKTIYEPFAGSGTVAIACEKTNRKCFMMELDPIYCDVIIAHWENFTRKKAKLIHV